MTFLSYAGHVTGILKLVFSIWCPHWTVLPNTSTCLPPTVGRCLVRSETNVVNLAPAFSFTALISQLERLAVT